MALPITQNPQFNATMREFTTRDPAHADLFNAANQTLLDNDNYLFNHKIDVVISRNKIPITERQDKTFYLFITDRQSVPAADTIKVSPNMGIKII